MCSVWSLCSGPPGAGTASYEELQDLALSKSLASFTLRLRSAGRVHRRQGREKWHPLTLAFPDAIVEQAFTSYLSAIRQHETRSALLVLSFQYILFQIFSWQTTDLVDLALRGGYVILLLTLFICSFSKVYLSNVQACALFVALITFFEAIGESALLWNLISPYTVLILVVLTTMWSVFVRFRYIYTLVLCATVIFVYDLVSFLLLGMGHLHISVPGKGSLATLMLYYNCILLLVSVAVCRMSHRFELQTRINFLSYCSNNDITTEPPSPSFEPSKRSSLLEATNSLLGVGHEAVPISVTSAVASSHSGATGTRTSQEPLLDAASTYGTLMTAVDDQIDVRKVSMDDRWNSFDSSSGLAEGVRDALDRIKAVHARRGFAGGIGLDFTTKFEDIVRNSGASSNMNFLRGQTTVTSADEEEPMDASVCEGRLVSSSELPDWFAPYPFVYSNYRISYTQKQSWRSIFEWHNETMNVWTEFAPMVAFSLYTANFMTTNSTMITASVYDRIIIYVGLTSALIIRPCLSGFAHLFGCMSSFHYVLWWGIDFFSICVAIVGSSLIYSHFTWYCEPSQYIFYLISTVGLLVSTLIAVLSAASSTVRVGSFLLLILLANGLPLGWQIGLQYTADASQKVPPEFIIYWLCGLGTMAIGLVIKSSMIPEICCPGKIDNFATSHNMWHLCINGGFIFMFPAIEAYLDWRKGTMCLIP